jgi:hypothetical protein
MIHKGDYVLLVGHGENIQNEVKVTNVTKSVQQNEQNTLFDLISKSSDLKQELNIAENQAMVCLIGFVSEISSNFALKMNILEGDKSIQQVQDSPQVWHLVKVCNSKYPNYNKIVQTMTEFCT